MNLDRLIATALRDAPAGFTGPQLVWWLLEECVAVWETGPLPGPKGYPDKSAMPESLPDPWEQFSVMREQIGDKIDAAPTRVRFVPTALQISRAWVVRDLWFVHAFTRASASKTMLRAVFLMARGASHKAVRAETGMTAQQRRRARKRGTDAIWRHLCREVPGLRDALAVVE